MPKNWMRLEIISPNFVWFFEKMDLPQPPADQDLRNIIDKLAQFVARNGPEFEHMTKTKQKDNPKFSFLFGGEFYHYYTYKVKTRTDI